MHKYYKPVLLFATIVFFQFNFPGYSQIHTNLLSNFNKFKTLPTDSNLVAVTNKLAEKYLYNNPDSAMYYGKVALRVAKKSNIKTEKAKAYNSIGRTYYVTGSFFESLSYSDSALAFSKNIGFKPGIAVAINTRGLIYLGQDRLNEAIIEFRKSLVLNGQLKDSVRIAANYFNIGIAYDQDQRFDSAFANLKKALWIAQDCKDGHLIQMSLNRIGEIYYHIKNYNQALFYFKSALNLAVYQDNWEKGFAFSGIALTLYEMKRFQEALAFAKKSFVLTKELKASWDIERAADILSKCYAALGDFKQGYEYQDISRAYGDSILNEKKEKEINYLHLQDKKAENLELLRENEKNRQILKTNRIILFLTALFSMVLLVLLLLLKRSITHKNVLNKKLQNRNNEISLQKEEILAQREELVALNKTKDRVFSVIGHDLRSPFASVVQALDHIRNGDLDERDQKYVFENFNRQISLVSGLIDNLLFWANSQQAGVKVKYEKVNITDITQDVLSLYHSSFQQKKLNLLHHYKEPVYIEADEHHVRIILQNIIGNAIKFTPHLGTISLFYSFENNFVAIHIKDNGKGMSEEKLSRLFRSSGQAISENGTDNEMGTGLGLLLIKQFIEENQGQIKVKSEKGKGSEFIVYFRSCMASKLAV